MVNETKFTCNSLYKDILLGPRTPTKIDMVRIKFSDHTYTLEIR